MLPSPATFLSSSAPITIIPRLQRILPSQARAPVCPQRHPHGQNLHPRLPTRGLTVAAPASPIPSHRCCFPPRKAPLCLLLISMFTTWLFKMSDVLSISQALSPSSPGRLYDQSYIPEFKYHLNECLETIALNVLLSHLEKKWPKILSVSNCESSNEVLMQNSWVICQFPFSLLDNKYSLYKNKNFRN